MPTRFLASATLSIALVLTVPFDAARADNRATVIASAPQFVQPSAGEIEQLMLRLHGMRVLPGVIIDLVEKAYRLYKLNKLHHDLQALRETSADALLELERLALRLQQDERRLAEQEEAIQRLERTVAELDAHMSNTERKARAKK